MQVSVILFQHSGTYKMHACAFVAGMYPPADEREEK